MTRHVLLKEYSRHALRYLTNPCLVKEILTPGVKVLDEEVLLLHGVHLGQVTAL